MKRKTKKATERVSVVWDDLCDTPGEAGKMLLRSLLIFLLNDHIKAHRWTKAVAAKRCGVSVATMELVRREKIGRLTADDLAAMIRTAGIDLLVKPTRYVAPK